MDRLKSVEIEYEFSHQFIRLSEEQSFCLNFSKYLYLNKFVGKFVTVCELANVASQSLTHFSSSTSELSRSPKSLQQCVQLLFIYIPSAFTFFLLFIVTGIIQFLCDQEEGWVGTCCQVKQIEMFLFLGRLLELRVYRPLLLQNIANTLAISQIIKLWKLNSVFLCCVGISLDYFGMFDTMARAYDLREVCKW